MATGSVRTAISRIAPLTLWLPKYDPRWLGRDALAGLAVAAVAIPTAMGYSTVALTPVQAGLYALPAALIMYAIFGSSRQLAIGPTSTVALMSGAVVAGIEGIEDPSRAIAMTAGVAVAAGVWLTLFGLLRLGWVTDFISRPVIVGFSFGLGLTVLAGELTHLLGIPPEDPHFVQRVLHTVENIGQTNPYTLAIGALGLAVLFIGGARRPAIPWALLLMVAGIVLAQFFDTRGHDVEVIGAIPAGLPTLGLPDVSTADIVPIAVGGLAVAVAAVGEGLSAARIFASREGYRINADSEFLGSGMANIGAGLSGGMGVCGSLSRTATSVNSGSRTQVSGLTAALVTVVFLLTLTGVLADVPRVILSCIVVVSVWFLLDVRTLRYYRRVRRNDFTSALAGLGGVVFFGPALRAARSRRPVHARRAVPVKPGQHRRPRQDPRREGRVGRRRRTPRAHPRARRAHPATWTPPCSGQTASPPTSGSSSRSTPPKTSAHWSSTSRPPVRWTPQPPPCSKNSSQNCGPWTSTCSSHAFTTAPEWSSNSTASPTISAPATCGTASPRP